MRQKHGQHGAGHIDGQNAKMQQYRQKVAPQGIDDQFQQVHGLCVCQNAAAAQKGIGTKKSADHGKGQVPVEVYFLTVNHGVTIFSVRLWLLRRKI